MSASIADCISIVAKHREKILGHHLKVLRSRSKDATTLRIQGENVWLGVQKIKDRHDLLNGCRPQEAKRVHGVRKDAYPVEDIIEDVAEMRSSLGELRKIIWNDGSSYAI